MPTTPLPQTELTNISLPVPPHKTFFGRAPWVEWLVLIALLLGGAGLRFSDLTQPPLDVHAWRQLSALMLARQFYLELLPNASPELKAEAVRLDELISSLEPPILPKLVAYTYLITGGERFWIARVYSILFWLIGGLALYGLARRMTSVDGGIAALAYYLFLPYANTHSRAFLPEPLMIMVMLLGLFAVYRWVETARWKWAIAAGVTLGLAILVKIFVVFPLLFGIPFFLLASWGWKSTLRSRQVWVFAGLTAVIPALYYLVMIPGKSSGYLEVWSLPFLHLLLEPLFYLRWLHRLELLFNPVFLFFSLVSLALLDKNKRWLLVGLWLGYVAEGMTVPSLIISHIYYNLYLTAIIALSLAGGMAFLLSKAAQQGWGWRIMVAVVLLAAVGDTALFARKEIHDVDYSQEPAFWQQLAASLPKDAKIIGMTEDYNSRLSLFGWRHISNYPTSEDFAMDTLSGRQVELSAISPQNWQTFLAQTNGFDYFLVTIMSEFDAQPYLREILYNYYPIILQGERYVVFDLQHPIQPVPAAGE